MAHVEKKVKNRRADDLFAKPHLDFDYEKKTEFFGSNKIDEVLLSRIQSLTGKTPHHFLRRNIFFSHRDMDEILNCYENKEQIYLFTGRGPSSSAMHFGHLIPFMFTKWLQETFNIPAVIQLTDDEKYFSTGYDYETIKRFTLQNAKDIIACGFDVTKTFLFSDIAFIAQCPQFYKNIVQIQANVTAKQVKHIFGFRDSVCIGKIAFPAAEAAPCISSTFPFIFGEERKSRCLVVCAVDQDPYFRLTRHVARKLRFPKPALLHSKYLPSLKSTQSKMSSTETDSAVFLTDSLDDIRSKIHDCAFSGGQSTASSHRKLGGNCDIDVSFQYLRFFLDDEQRLNTIREKYTSGDMMTFEVKNELISLMQKIAREHQLKRSQISDELVAEFMRPRELNLCRA